MTVGKRGDAVLCRSGRRYHSTSTSSWISLSLRTVCASVQVSHCAIRGRHRCIYPAKVCVLVSSGYFDAVHICLLACVVDPPIWRVTRRRRVYHDRLPLDIPARLYCTTIDLTPLDTISKIGTSNPLRLISVSLLHYCPVGLLWHVRTACGEAFSFKQGTTYHQIDKWRGDGRGKHQEAWKGKVNNTRTLEPCKGST